MTCKKKRINYRLLIRTTMLLLAVLLLTAEVYARAGGGGGGSSGGDGDGLGAIIYFILFTIPFPYNVILIGVVILLYYLGRKKARARSVLNKMNENAPLVPNGEQEFYQRNPEFNLDAFTERVKTAFLGIQTAWSGGSMSPVRRFISDGVYQRFNTQFRMMKQLEMTNKLEKVELLDVRVYGYEPDGEYDVIHVAVSAALDDKFVSKKYPELNSGGGEAFLEYWSFIRKKGVAEKNLYSNNNCPQCGAELPTDMGEVSKCSHCGAITAMGDYDWVLCEITQADDFIFQNRKITSYGSGHIKKIRSQLPETPGLSIQHLEDKVANGFLQMQTARTHKDPSMLRRFVSDDLYQRMEDQIKNEAPFVYSRIYLNDVTVTGANKNGNLFNIQVAVKMSFQRVDISSGKLSKLDYTVMSDTWLVNLTHEADQTPSKGSLYAHTCPYCGGTLGDTIDVKCQWCGQVLNSSKGEWIISSVSEPGYMSYDDSIPVEEETGFAVLADAGKIDDLLDVRDYAFNNVAVMVAVDGNISDEETAFLRSLAKKWGYSPSKIEPMISLAINNRLPIRMPDNPKKREKIIKLMEKAANADGSVCEAEQQLIDKMKKDFLNK